MLTVPFVFVDTFHWDAVDDDAPSVTAAPADPGLAIHRNCTVSQPR